MSLLGSLMGRRPKPRPTGEDLILAVVIVIVCVLLAVTFVYWATGQVAGRLFGGTWPDVPFARMPFVLAEALRDPADPAAAWPPAAERLLPGPLGFYTVMAGLLLVPVSAAVTALYLVLRDGRRGAAAPPARRRRRRSFASRRALRPLLVGSPQPGRITLGRSGGRLLAAEAGESVAVLGPTRSLKTSGLALPAVLEWPGPVVVTSTSARLVLDSLERRQTLGTIRAFDPAGVLGAGMTRVSWSPLHQAGSWSGAQRAARSLAAAAADSIPRPSTLPGVAGDPEEGSGAVAAATLDLLAAALLAAERTGRAIGDALGWLEGTERDELRDALEAAGVRVATVAFAELWEQEPSLRERAYVRAARVLAPWAGAEARQAPAAEQLDPAELLDGGAHTLYLTAPEAEAQAFRPLLATVLQEVVAAAQDHTRRGDPRLLLVLDDAADAGAPRTLDVLAAGASQGIQVLSVFTSLTEVRDRYGDRADAVLNGHRARIVMSGTTDPETLDYVANLLGDPEIAGRGQVRDQRRLTPAGVLREPQPGVGLLLYGSLPPVELTLRPWFKDRGVRALVGPGRLAAYTRSRSRRPPRRPAVR